MKEKLKQWLRYRELKQWFEKYERFLMPGALLLGVIFDSFTFAAINTSAAFFCSAYISRRGSVPYMLLTGMA